MKALFNLTLLALVVLCLGTSITLFGGILPEQALPFYVVTAALLIVWGFKWVVCHRVSGVWSPVHWPVIGFLIYTVIRYFGSPVEHASRMELLQVGLYALVYFLVSQNFHRPRDRVTLLCALTVFAVVESAYALWQYRTASDQVLWLDRATDYHGRGSGTYYCPNHLAGLLELALGLLAGWFIVYRDPDAPLQSRLLRRLFTGAAIAFIAVGIFTTESRGGWLAIVITIPLMLVMAEATRTVSSRTVIAAFVVFVVVAGSLLALPSIRNHVGNAIGFDLQYRIGEQPVEVKSGLGGRTAMWHSSLRMVVANPAFGTGPGTWQWTQLKYRLPASQIRPQYAHNDVLQLAAEYGVTGWLLILAVFVGFYWQALRLARTAMQTEQRAFAIGALAAVTAILIHSFVDFNFHIPANALVVAVLVGLIAAQTPASESHDRTRVPLLIKTAVGIIVIALGGAGVWALGAVALAGRAAARGFEAAQEYEWDTALREYHTALRYDPRAPEIHTGIGDIYRVQSAETTDEELLPERQLIARRAMDSYRRAVEYNPLHSEAMLKMAAACELAGDPALAFRWYEQALQIDPQNAFSWLRLGTFYHRQGDTEKAILALEHACKLNPGDWTAPNALQAVRAGQP